MVLSVSIVAGRSTPIITDAPPVTPNRMGLLSFRINRILWSIAVAVVAVLVCYPQIFESFIFDEEWYVQYSVANFKKTRAGWYFDSLIVTPELYHASHFFDWDEFKEHEDDSFTNPFKIANVIRSVDPTALVIEPKLKELSSVNPATTIHSGFFWIECLQLM
jgi:hypothetical protein